MESTSLASSFSKTTQISASSKGQAQPLPLLNFIYVHLGHSHRLDSFEFSSAKPCQSPATWHHWLDITGFLSIHHPSCSQTY